MTPLATGWVPAPIACAGWPADDRAMTEARQPTTASAWPHAPAPVEVAGRDAPLASRAGDLAEAARLVRDAARHPQSASELALAFSHLQGVLDDLAVSAELAADAVIEHCRTPGAPATSPTPPRARSISWRLHALRARLVAARDTCAEVSCASQDAPPPAR